MEHAPVNRTDDAEIADKGRFGGCPQHENQGHNLDKDSYLLHDERCDQILNSLSGKVTALTKTMRQVSVATQDWGTDNMIRAALTERIQLMQQADVKLRERRQAIDYYLANPDKIPVIQTQAEPEDQSRINPDPSETAPATAVRGADG